EPDGQAKIGGLDQSRGLRARPGGERELREARLTGPHAGGPRRGRLRVKEIERRQVEPPGVVRVVAVAGDRVEFQKVRLVHVSLREVRNRMRAPTSGQVGQTAPGA